MKTQFLACLILSFAPEAQSATLINNVTIYPALPPDVVSPMPGSFSISYHGFSEALFTPISSTAYRFSYLGIAEEFAFYNVSPGDLIDPGYVERTARLISNTNNPGSAIFDIPMFGSKYLGYWAGFGLQEEDYFGWVRVSRTPEGLVASESATSVGNGIQVGSFSEVPETSVPVLCLCTMATLLKRRRDTVMPSSIRRLA